MKPHTLRIGSEVTYNNKYYHVDSFHAPEGKVEVLEFMSTSLTRHDRDPIYLNVAELRVGNAFPRVGCCARTIAQHW